MRSGSVTLALLCLLLAPPVLAAEPGSGPPAGWDDAAFLSVDRVQPGMQAVGRSVFVGTRVDTFHAEILGVVQTGSPGGEMILARLSGRGLEKSGVIAGMSGSPIYIDGKLIGALAFGWPFASEPIAGITPIAEMLRIFDRSGGAPPASDSGASGPRSGLPPEAWRELLSSRGEEAWPLLLDAFPASAEDPGPLTMPVTLGGLDPAVRETAGKYLGELGLLPVQGGASARAMDSPSEPLVPGSPVGVTLVRGDAQIGITGTVTWSDGSRLLAFGHPMFSLGPTRFPLCRAEVVTVLPRLNSSFKISAMGEPVGTLSRDYSAGIMGELGPAPDLIPMTVDIRVGDRAQSLSYELVDADLITPVLAGIVSMNSVAAFTRSAGSATARTEIAVSLADGRTLTTRGVAAGFAPPAAIGGEAARLVGLLAGNPFEEVSIDRIRVKIDMVEEIEAAFLDEISVPPGPHRPGDRIPVELELRDYRGEVRKVRTSFTVPVPTPAGTYTLAVCDGTQAARLEQERAPGAFAPKSLDQLISLVEAAPPENEIVLRLYQDATSPVVGGREFPRLPGSVETVLTSPLYGGRNQPAQKTVIAQESETLSGVVLGCQSLSLSVEARR